MPYFLVDDAFYSHPKAVRAGNAACGAWVKMGSWCSDHLTDGVIPVEVAATLSTKREREKLLEVGLLKRESNSLIMHDYLDYNPDKRTVLQNRKKRSEAGKLGAASRWGKNGKTDSKRHGTPHEYGNGKPDGKTMPQSPEPRAQYTEPKKNAPLDPPSGGGGDVTPLPDDWTPTASHRKAAIKAGVDLEYEAAKFRADARSKGIVTKSWNGKFATWLRKCRPSAAPLPADWAPAESTYAWARTEKLVRFDRETVDDEVTKMVAWARSRGASMPDWDARLQLWLIEARKRDPGIREPRRDMGPKPAGPPPQSPEFNAKAAEVQRRLEAGEQIDLNAALDGIGRPRTRAKEA